MTAHDLPPRWHQRRDDEWVDYTTGWTVRQWSDNEWEVRPSQLPMPDWFVVWRFDSRKKAMRFAELTCDRFVLAVADMRHAIEDARREVEREGE